MMLPSRDSSLIRHILKYCVKIEKTLTRCGGDFRVFAADPDFIDSVSMNILQIGELAGRLSPEYVLASKEQIDWRAIRGMRNIIAHDYGAVDIDMVWDVAKNDIPVLAEYCTEQLSQFDQQQE